MKLSEIKKSGRITVGSIPSEDIKEKLNAPSLTLLEMFEESSNPQFKEQEELEKIKENYGFQNF